jgi:hypothetical protein
VDLQIYVAVGQFEIAGGSEVSRLPGLKRWSWVLVVITWKRIAGDESGTAMKRSRVASDLFHLRSGRSTPLDASEGALRGGGFSGSFRIWKRMGERRCHSIRKFRKH